MKLFTLSDTSVVLSEAKGTALILTILISNIPFAYKQDQLWLN